MHWKNYLAIGVAVALLGCSGGDGPSDPGNGGGDGNGDGNPLAVTVRNNSFDPATLAVPVNGMVTWTWSSQGIQHNVTFDDEAIPDSPTQGSGTFSHTFGTAGSFAYVCTIHAAQGMTGVITVGTGSGGGGDGGGGGDYP